MSRQTKRGEERRSGETERRTTGDGPRDRGNSMTAKERGRKKEKKQGALSPPYLLPILKHLSSGALKRAPTRAHTNREAINKVLGFVVWPAYGNTPWMGC